MRVAVKDLDSHLKQLMSEIKSEVHKFHAQLELRLVEVGVDAGRLESIRAPLTAALANRTEKATAKVKDAVQVSAKSNSRPCCSSVPRLYL